MTEVSVTHEGTMRAACLGVVLWLASLTIGLADPAVPTSEEIIEKAKETYSALLSYSSTGLTTVTGAGPGQITIFTIRLQRPGQYRIDWSQGTNIGAAWSDGAAGDFILLAGQTQKQPSLEMALAGATGVSGGAAANIPGTFFEEHWGNTLNPDLPSERMGDETFEGIGCFVVSSKVTPPNGGTITTTLWIGQSDYLIHQIKTVMNAETTVRTADFTDAQIEQMLNAEKKPVTPESMEQMRAEMKSSTKTVEGVMKGKTLTFTQVQENIVTNKKFVAGDFNKP